MAREYDIAGASGLCRGCGRELAAGEEFVAVLLDGGQEFRREDFCAACWQSRPDERAEVFSIWRSRVPPPAEPKKKVVDAELLVEFFNKLEGHEEPLKVNSRFVLALMLMRKKLLAYEGSSTDEAGREVWTMRFKHDHTQVEVLRPRLSEEEVAAVSSQLGAIFGGSP